MNCMLDYITIVSFLGEEVSWIMDNFQIQIALFGNCCEQRPPFFLLYHQPVLPPVFCLWVLLIATWSVACQYSGKIHKVWVKMLREFIKYWVWVEGDELITANPRISTVSHSLTKVTKQKLTRSWFRHPGRGSRSSRGRRRRWFPLARGREMWASCGSCPVSEWSWEETRFCS